MFGACGGRVCAGDGFLFFVGGLTSGFTGRGFFGRGDMQKEFEEVAFGLEVGEVSGIVDSPSGVHLIERFVVGKG